MYTDWSADVLLRCMCEHIWLCWGGKLYKVSVFCVCVCLCVCVFVCVFVCVCVCVCVLISNVLESTRANDSYCTEV